MAQTQYCDLNGLQDRLSSYGVTSRTDDTPPSDYGDVIDDASSQVEAYCVNYTAANLSGNEWVKQRCLDIAAWLLCTRRGDPPPPGVVLRYERAIEQLDRVHMGGLRIPGCSQTIASVPTLSNQRVIMTRTGPRVATERRGSTSKGNGYVRRDDPLEPIGDWVI